ncbi:GNAT family N-acetyltransferase [Neptunomonas sp.]|uniref:GNAT family N-acetyltransferase n=1 Tax=Neptunomonas sp. TaxID=1971898 RepID=UPI0035667BC4
MDNRKKNAGLPMGDRLEYWQSRPIPQRKVMPGRYCSVEPLQPEAHAEQLYQAFAEDTQEVNWTYLPYGPFKSFESFNQWLSDSCSTDDPLFFVIIDKRTSVAVGLVSFLRIDAAVGVIEVGHIHFSPRLQQTRLATEAMYLMMRRVFDDLGYRRYEWKCDACNEGSKKAALRLGFRFEGVFRQATIYKQRNRDTAWFSVIDKEWPAIRAGLEDWLDHTNFDHHGQQRKGLQECY